MKCYFCNGDIPVRHTKYFKLQNVWFTGTCFNHKSFKIIQSRFNTTNYPVKSANFEFSKNKKLIIDFKEDEIVNCIYYCN